MAKSSVTKTLGPIHFEDLDPHRFEDLVRQLVYDFRDWQTIEATGRTGDDAGFDIRAFERGVSPLGVDAEDEEPPIVQFGNLWMIQAKREKSLGPARIREIVKDIPSDSPPYGYLLAASANISKRTHDVFHSELRARGVSEYYLWGKGELEDLLLQPKNDRVLFAFFGISLASRRRSRATEIRQVISTKNKLLRTLDENDLGHVSILVRDANDTEYPYKRAYHDFKARPHWKEYVVAELHPRGVIVKLAEHFAYVDRSSKTFACDTTCNLVLTASQLESHDPAWHDSRSVAEHRWEHIPARMQARFHRNGLIRYEDILVVDEKGDNLHRLPHLFVDFARNGGPVAGTSEFATTIADHVYLDDFEELPRWPIATVKPGFGTIYPAGTIRLSETQQRALHRHHDRVQTLYDIDGQLASLK